MDDVTERITSWQREQCELQKQLITEDPEWLKDKLTDGSLIVGGLDISYSKRDLSLAIACLVVVRLSDLKVIFQQCVPVHLTVPYVPTFLAFREVPAYEELLSSAQNSSPTFSLPDVLMLDGNGTLHPRGFGSACQLGVRLQWPTIGVAKELLNPSSQVKPENDCSFIEFRKKVKSGIDDRFEILNDDGEVCGVFLHLGDWRNPSLYRSGILHQTATIIAPLLKTNGFRRCLLQYLEN